MDKLNVIPVKRGKSNSKATVWRLLIDFTLLCDIIGQTVQVTFKIPELNGTTFRASVKSRSKIQQINVTYDLDERLNVSLWWPNGYGSQPRYTLQGSVDGKAALERTFGFRQVDLVQDPVKAPNGTSAGLTFYFKVNGIPIFAKGSNWIPKDSFLSRVSCENLKDYFKTMVAAHFNTLRVWGGGIYEQDCFYDLADVYGIMIWQDFMFASALYPATPDFLDSVRQEVIDQVSRIKSHPSILVWAGNNENEAGLASGWWKLDAPKKRYIADYMLLYNETIRSHVLEMDSSRPFVLSSPSNGKKSEEEGGVSKNPYDQLYGDTHFYDYDHDPWAISTYPIPRFASEFGYQSLPAMQTWLTAMTKEDLGYFSDGVIHRQHHPAGQLQMLLEIIQNLPAPRSCANLANKTDVAICFAKSISFESIIYLTQINQAMAIRGEVEHYRRMKSTVCPDGRGLTMGALYWQLNDIWQAPSWSSIDYDGRWKMLHYYAQAFFEPLMVSIYVDTNRIFASVISDLLDPIDDVTFRLDILPWNSFSPVYSYNVSIPIIAPLKSKLIYKSPSTLKTSENDLVAVGRLYKNGQPISRESVIFLSKLYKVGYKQFGSVKISGIRNRTPRSVFVDLTATAISPFVWLEAFDGLQGVFSENGFTQTSPNRTVVFTAKRNVNLGTISAGSFTVKTLRDPYV